MEKAKRYKVVRTCPRCGCRAYHFGNDMGIHHQIRCASCAHVWRGRIRKDEEQ